jgi:hypothetical protein
MKWVIVFALAFALVVAQDLSVFDTKTNSLAGADPAIVELVANATVAIEAKWGPLDPSAGELVVIKANVTAELSQKLGLIDVAGIYLVGKIGEIQANVTRNYGQFDSWRTKAIADLNSNYTEWDLRIKNLTATRDEALDGTRGDIARLKAAVLYHWVKLGEKVAAVTILVGVSNGDVVDLEYRTTAGALIYANNSLALNGISLNISWTNLDKTELTANLTAVATAGAVAHYRLRKLQSYLPEIRAELQDAAIELRDKVANWEKNAWAALKDLKAQWSANKTRVALALAERINEFLERYNTSSGRISVQGLETLGNISIDLEIVAGQTDGDTAAAEAYLRDHLRILIAAYVGVKADNVTVSVTAGVKRASGSTYQVATQIGSPDNGNGAGSLTLGAAAILVAIAALLRIE